MNAGSVHRDGGFFLSEGGENRELLPLVGFKISGAVGLLVFLLFLGVFRGDLQAVPYASSLTNSGTHISFRLNEAADRVLLVWAGGLQTNDLGPLSAGLHTFSMVVVGDYSLLVDKISPPGFLTPVAPNHGRVLQISPDTNATRFNSPKGIALNANPASPYFGRIYVANSAAGAATNLLFGPERQLGDGIYILNADFTDAVGQGDQPLTGGLQFLTNSAQSPFRLTLGQDDNLYIADFGDITGSLYVVDPNVSPGSGTNVLGGPADGHFPVGPNRIHGSISAAVVEGTKEAGTLVAYVIDDDLQSDPSTSLRFMLNSLWRHNLGGDLPGPEVLPDLVVRAPWFNLSSQIMDLSRGINGYFYVNNYRGHGDDRGGLYVHDADGLPLWNSLDETRLLLGNLQAPDLLGGTGGGGISVDGQWVATVNLETNLITLLPLAEGIPDLARRLVFDGFEYTNGLGGDLTFDAAGNLYVVSCGAQVLRVFSPGGATRTVSGSQGTFELLRPPTLTVTAAVELTGEGSLSPGIFTFERTGDTNKGVQVGFELSGSAVNGLDYVTIPLTISIPPGVTEVELPVVPLQDLLAEEPENVTVTLVGSPFYDLGVSSSATIWIQDDERAMVRVSVLQSNAYERLPENRILFEVERLGETNSGFTLDYDLSSGTATPGIDFYGINGQELPTALEFAPGQTRVTLALEPIDDRLFEGPETVQLRLLPDGGSRYVLGTPAEATAYLIDDEVPKVPLSSTLWRTDFEWATSTNWIVRFGANNGIYDAIVDWNFDYTPLGIPPSPHSGFKGRSGLFVQINKTNSTAGGAAGINFYPADLMLRGNYALRFDFYMRVGTASPTEHVVAGLNHSGQATNRVTQSIDTRGTTRGGDGIWVALSSNGADELPCAVYSYPTPDAFPTLITNRPASELTDIFPVPPYTFPGSPGEQPGGSETWSEAELSMARNVFTFKLNNRIVCSFTNTTAFTNGTVMIGLNDQFDSIGSGGTAGNFVIFDNVRVVNLEIVIVGVAITENDTVQLDFVSQVGGEPGDFRVESTTGFEAPVWHAESQAVITRIPVGFRATFPRGSITEYFRVRRLQP